uniref:Nucleotide-diphospho-sugar transferase domain-containing protein n=1 Tax=Compsopogon caeruleus TaxID=31354 RepID=A0A7S1XFF9_9RHOD|mmetsp:Transcript_3488/g.6551  ORF Transcript_3488/g.6551 Transcript_3488/m.6551 type:complete len:356 (+) Transcript_3488:97-1164(+)
MASDSERKGMVQGRRARLIRLALMLAVLLLSAAGVYRAEMRVASAEDARLVMENRMRQLEENARIVAQSATSASWVQRGVGKRFAILTAYEGNHYNVMGHLSAQTKAKYAALHGYAFFMDNDLLNNKMNFNQKSASRIALFRRHWNDYEWLLWTDADVLLTNPKITFDSLIDKHAPQGSNIHVIMSKDWGGRQVNPGVCFIRTSPEGKSFVDRWEKEIEKNKIHDDLLAIRDGMERDKAPELNYVAFVKQSVLNSYPEMILKHLPYNSTTVEHDPSHELWKSGDLFVHVVNCLRQSWRIDSPCCDGIAARYWLEFHLALDSILEAKRKSMGIQYEKKGTVFSDWTVPFGSDLGLL